MSLFVLVHGGWGGGWQWRAVANRLRGLGHEVYAPTLSGMGDRSGAAEDPATLDLSRHIDDVVQLFEFEDCRDAVLVGWSYGGLVVEGVADRVPDRLRLVVELDAEPPDEGRPMLDSGSPETVEAINAMAAQSPEPGWVRPPTAEELAGMLADPDLRRWVADRERPMAYSAFVEPYPDTGAARHAVAHAYIRCTIDDEPEPPRITALRTNDQWQFVELPLNHLGLLYDPDQVAKALHTLS
ncbi:MAG: alpha/beta hydrolase [Actinomycetota bacterium]|nr:alpha/beta hydrolase [Actinomycetota bacterium]